MQYVCIGDSQFTLVIFHHASRTILFSNPSGNSAFPMHIVMPHAQLFQSIYNGVWSTHIVNISLQQDAHNCGFWGSCSTRVFCKVHSTCITSQQLEDVMQMNMVNDATMDSSFAASLRASYCDILNLIFTVDQVKHMLAQTDWPNRLWLPYTCVNARAKRQARPSIVAIHSFYFVL